VVRGEVDGWQPRKSKETNEVCLLLQTDRVVQSLGSNQANCLNRTFISFLDQIPPHIHTYFLVNSVHTVSL